MGRRYRFSLFSYAAGGHRTCQGAGRWGWAGALSAMDGAKRGPHGCGCCRPPHSPTARPKNVTRFRSSPPRGGSTRSTTPSAAQNHDRRSVSANGPLRSPTMVRRYRFSLFSYAAGGHGTCQGAGRWGWAGALSAMDGAKRGPHGCGCCRPPHSPTARPQARNPLFAAVPREGVPPVRRRLLRRRTMVGGGFLPTARCARRPWVGATAFLFFHTRRAATEPVGGPGGGAGRGR